MTSKTQRVKVGIVGCGAIGSGIAKSIQKSFKKACQVTALYDIDHEKANQLAKDLSVKKAVKKSIPELIKTCDVLVEAVSAKNTRDIIRQALSAGKSVLPMSTGKLLNAPGLFELAKQKKCHLLIPSGAIAGIDAVKSASLVGIDTITLTTRKPLTGFANNPYLAKKRIDPLKLKKETVIFKGKVSDAVKAFPKNINVAATLALASNSKKKLIIRIITSPKFKVNSHEIELTGKFGRIVTRTDNLISPDNPKTSYLAILSGIQTLKQYCEGVFIGT